MSTRRALAAVLALCAAGEAAPALRAGVKPPPCYSAYTREFESICYDQVAVGHGGSNVSVRAYAVAGGATITAYANSQPGQGTFYDALEGGLAQVLPYFSPGFNSKLEPINRTVPIMATHVGSPSDPFAESWTVAMALPASVFPDAAAAPAPTNPFSAFTTPFAGNPLVAVRHFVTAALPVDADWAANAAYLAANLPAGYTAASGAPYTFAIYDVRDATGLRNNEVWLPVTAA